MTQKVEAEVDEAALAAAKSISQEEAFFKTVIDFIPPEHYGYDEEVKAVLQERKHALIDDKLSAEKRANLSSKSKSRLARLDDRQCRTNSQIFAYMAEIKGRGGGGEQQTGKKRKREQPPAGDDEPIEEDGGKQRSSGGKVGKTKETGKKKKKTETDDSRGPNKKKIADSAAAGSTETIASGRQHLLTKLQSKLDELRAKRGAPITGSERGMDFEEKKRLKRRLSKAKLKERRRTEKNNNNQTSNNRTEPADVKSPANLKKTIGGYPLGTSPQARKPPQKNTAQPTTTTKSEKNRITTATTSSTNGGGGGRKPAIIDKDGRMVFSKFDFAVPGIVTEQQQEKDKWAKKNTGKDYKRLLEKQTRLQDKLQKMEDADNAEGAKKLKEKTQWEAATQRAKGVKVKDDPALLKKNLKRKEKRKEQSSRKWDSRKDAVRKKQAEQQQKRRDNIQARKKENKDRKLTKARKKGRLV